MRRWILTLLLGCGLAMSAGAQDAEGDPQALVRETTREVLGALEEHRDEIQGDPRAVYRYVADLVLPRFDFELMSRFVLGRHWQNASAEQQQRFVEEFRRLLVRTYGTSLSEYSGQEVEFPAARTEGQGKRVSVPTEVVQDKGPNIPVDYKLYRNESGTWKVFDVVIDGVSLVQNYRSSFGTEVSRNGLDALIERLAKRNAERGVPGSAG